MTANCLRIACLALLDPDLEPAEGFGSVTSRRLRYRDLADAPFSGHRRGGEQTTVLVIPLERAPDHGETLSLPNGERVTVRHVISAARDGLAGIVLAGPTDTGSGDGNRSN